MAAYEAYSDSEIAYMFQGSAARRLERPISNPAEEKKPQPVNRHIFGLIKPKALVCLGMVAVLTILWVFANLNLYQLAETATDLQTQLTQLETERDILRSRYDSMIDYKEIETKATTELGMSKPTAGQIIYVNLDGQDEGVVLSGNSSTVFTELAGFIQETFEKLGAYLTTTES